MSWRRLAPAGAFACAVALASCGGGERQDSNERRADYRVEVVRARFPQAQKLAKRSELVITVRNAETDDRKVVPNVAVTVRGFDERLDGRGLADPSRPVFVLNGVPKEIGTFPESKDAAPEGGETAYVSTWALGKLRPGQRKTFRWSVTAVRPGPYRIRYEVAAGLDGKAKARVRGQQPKGIFVGTISDEAPQTRVAEDGETIVRGAR